MNRDHDGSYHLVYSNPEMIRDLILHFVDEPWVSDLDFSNLQRINAKSHIEGLFDPDEIKRREGDIIFRVTTFSGETSYLYLMLEFQSRPEFMMANRVSLYSNLLLEQIYKEKQLTPNNLLPPLFPIVLYNGDQRWQYPVELKKLIDLPKRSPLWPYQPQIKYHLIDEARYPKGIPGSLSGALFKVENSKGTDSIRDSALELVKLLENYPSITLTRNITTWLKHILDLPRQKVLDLSIDQILKETRIMLKDNFEQAKKQLFQEGIEQGREQGIYQGIELGATKSLTIQLSHRFGPLTEFTLNKIKAANPVLLEKWSIRVLNAESLDAVFTESA